MLYESRYTGWTVKHFYERWQTEHGGRLVLYLDQESAPSGGPCSPCPAAWRSHRKEATAQTVTRDDAASRWLDS